MKVRKGEKEKGKKGESGKGSKQLNRSTQRTYIHQLPDELLAHVTGLLPIRDKLAMRQTCRRFADICDTAAAWRNVQQLSINAENVVQLAGAGSCGDWLIF